MPEAQIAQGLQLLDLMLEYFSDDVRWTRGRYDDGNGGHCLVGALLHLSRKHRLPRAQAIALLQDAMPRPSLPLVHFNDRRCGSVAELRSIILKARCLADAHAEQERAAATARTWLLTQLEKKRPAPSADIVDTVPDEPFAPGALPPSDRCRSPRCNPTSCGYPALEVDSRGYVSYDESIVRISRCSIVDPRTRARPPGFFVGTVALAQSAAAAPLLAVTEVL